MNFRKRKNVTGTPGVKLTNGIFITRATEIHGGKYGYDRVVYSINSKKVDIWCNEHKKYFSQTPANHLKGSGCPLCKKDTLRECFIHTGEKFISHAKEVHGDKYDYSRVKYVNNGTKVDIVCRKHGVFSQTPGSHLCGCGCPLCKLDKLREHFSGNVEKFISHAKEVHGDKYDYSRVKYVNNGTKVDIVCRKHGSFLQTPNKHLYGQGCPKCSSSRGEQIVSRILDKNNIEYIREWWFPDETHRYKYDFYLPSQNVITEYHGEQHYKLVQHFYKSEEKFLRRKDIDKFKVHMARAKRIPHIEIKNIPIKQLRSEEFEELLLNIINNIQNRPRPKYNIHLLVEYNKDKNKYKIRYT